MVEILKQPQFKPMNVIDQVMIIYAGTKGYLDKVPRKQVPAWEEQFLHVHEASRSRRCATLLVKEKKLTPDESSKQLNAAIDGVPAAVQGAEQSRSAAISRDPAGGLMHSDSPVPQRLAAER